MSSRGGNGGYPHGVQPNHTSSRNFGPNRPNLNHRPSHMIPPNQQNIPLPGAPPNVGYGQQPQNHIGYPGLVHSMPQVPRYPPPNHQHHHQQQYPVQYPLFFYSPPMQQIHGNPHQFAAIARASVSGHQTNSPYNVSQGIVSSTDTQMFYNDQFMPQPAQAQELNSVTPATMQHMSGQTLTNKVATAPTKRARNIAVIADPNTLEVLSQEYLRSPASTKLEAKPDASSNTNATSTTPKTASEKKVKESMNDLDVRIESDQVTISNVTPEPIDDSSNSSSTNSSNTLSSEVAATESKPPKTGSDKIEEQANDLDARIESDQLTVSSETTPEPTEDSSASSSTTHSSNQVVIEGKQELKSVESTTHQVSPVNEEIPNSNDISSSSESKDTSTEETRQPDPIDVVDHAAVMTREESISTKNDFSQSKEITETSVNKVSPSEIKEENKENDKPAVEHPKSNAKGKYEYEAEFLRSLQSHPLSLKKPDLPDLDIVQQVPITQREKQSNRVNDFLPSYMAPSRNNRSLPLRISGRNGRELRPSKPPVKIIPSPSLNQDVSLHTVENAWKPAIPALKPAENIDEEEKKTLELVKRFRGILNKLTPQKYDDLIRQVDALAIDSEDRLKRVLELIFDKAVDEPAFCTDYAKLCKHISTKKSVDKDKASEKDDKTKEKQFKSLLLSRCQKEFESDIYKDINIDERMADIESITDPEKKKIAQLELDEDKRKARKRTLGIIKFIGELYMFDMLRGVIMDNCVHSLLKTKDDESLECLCTLLRTVGAKWEQDSAKRPSNAQIGYCIKTLQEIVQQQLTSSRVRFMIQDVLDMKQAGWKVRKIQAENKPKTIEQLHAEILQEEQIKKHEIQQHINKSGDTNKIPSKQDDWNSNSQRNRNNTPNMLQTLEGLKKMNLETSQADTIALHPQRGVWSSGASLGAGTSTQRSQQNSDPFGRNSLNERDKNPRNSGNNSGRNSMEGRIQSSGSYKPFLSIEKEPSSGYPGRASIGNRTPSSISSFGNTDSSTKKETPSRSNSTEKSGSSDSRASSNNSNSNIARESPKKEVTQGFAFKGQKDQPDSKVSEKATNCVKEFLTHSSKKEARDDVLDLCTEDNVHVYVEAAINLSLDLSSHEQRLLIGDLLGYLVKEKVVKQDHFCKGLHGILEIASDMLIDIPLLWNNLAEVLVPLFCSLDNSSRKKFFTKALEPCKKDDTGGAALIMYHILNYKKNNPKSPYDCASTWVSGELEWSSFLPSKEKNLDKFLEKHSLEKPVFDLQIKLEALSNYVKKNNPNLILEYISKQFTPEEVKEPKFLRALTEAVVNKCVSQSGGTNISYKLNHKKLSDHCPILTKFHNGQKDLELEIIFAVQALIGDYVNPPKGLLSEIFDNLYRKASISTQAFIDWESDKTFVNNKKAAMLMVKDFLTKLKEGGSGSDS